jgi:acylphosphatase
MHGMTVSARFEVHGRVQGVGYRAFVLREASVLRLQGWVRNCADGSVEVAAIGAAEDLGRLQHRLHAGPPGAQVTRVDRREWAAPARIDAGFMIAGFMIQD